VRAVLFLLALSVLPGCSCYGTRASDVLQRMETQDKILPYGANELFADGRGMRTPPENTISREAVVGAPGITTGMMNGELVTQIPIPVTPELLARGRHRFEIVCSNCHGLVGNGDSMIADNMATRLPPSTKTRVMPRSDSACSTASGSSASAPSSPAGAR